MKEKPNHINLMITGSIPIKLPIPPHIPPNTRSFLDLNNLLI